MSTRASSNTAAAASTAASPAGANGELIAVCLTDEMGDGLSMVYSFYDPDAARPLASAPS